MNSEELELSLRTEFENYLKNVVDEMKQDVADFQSKIDAEFEKHRTQVNEAFQGFSARFESGHEFDEGFRALVIEHLQIARDEGAKLSANAFAEAEKIDAENAAPPPPANYSELRDAINDISSKDSQSTILKSLVEHAANFAPRGAFFIIKNENFAGWKVFGEHDESAEEQVRDIHFPTSGDSILGKASASGSTVEDAYGAHSEDSEFLGPLGFGQPERMYAIPLVARGRGVAVMYADHGTAGAALNLEALETIVRVAALTVELIASSQTAKAENREMAAANFEDAPQEHSSVAEPAAGNFEESSHPTSSFEAPAPEFNFSDSVSHQGGFASEPVVSDPEPFRSEPEPFVYEPEPDETENAFEPFHAPEPVAERYNEPEVVEETFTAETPYFAAEPPPAQVEEQQVESAPAVDSHSAAMVFDTEPSTEPAVAERTPFDRTVEPFEPAAAIGSGGGRAQAAVETAIEVSPASLPQARLSDRPVDLPIEVPEEERRLHNDARRFARLLVSEIKLYNEKKVLEGRQSHDLYDRLREAIDRSREMYDKRVQPPVAARFDYFHYELLNALAEGNADRFGANYPGATI